MALTRRTRARSGRRHEDRTAPASGSSSIRHVAGVAPIVLSLAMAGCAARGPDPVRDTPARPRGTTELERIPSPPPAAAPSGPGPLTRRPPPLALPETIHQPPPGYPESAVGDRVACRASILYHVQTDGSARLVRLEWEAAPPESYRGAFESAIRAAVETWRFEPAYQLVFTERPEGPVYEKRRVPHAAGARLRFRVEDGKPVVD